MDARLVARRRQRALDRSRRNSNPAQYQLSTRQAKRATRRAAAGIRVRQVPTPLGPRVANAVGIPRQAYDKDELCDAYRRTRAGHAVAGRAGTQAKQARAREIARTIVAEHGPRLVVEHTNIRAWARLWGRGIALFSPGMLTAALKLECAAAGGQLLRAGTTRTALSQQCPCGARAKKPLSQRVHRCRCGIVGDRDLVAAAMAACVQLEDEDQPTTATINEDFRAALAARIAVRGQQ
ncbi:zinc ribbon domain-containing protein [Actinoplanes sp. CA-030573]|uniref:zinc ribbon domain-containing protein n=1 Tax=Actinoplanes sp. CA-030573 TaxID=3239898 RepID=UPI003D93B42B